jgi:hypothetical protein
MWWPTPDPALAHGQACWWDDQGMSERFTFAFPAPPDSRYAPGALDRQAGQPVQVNAAGGAIEGILVGAAVSDDGSEVEITVDVPDGTIPAFPVIPWFSPAG